MRSWCIEATSIAGALHALQHVKGHTSGFWYRLLQNTVIMFSMVLYNIAAGNYHIGFMRGKVYMYCHYAELQ
jgi:hypothetical protein